MSEAETNQTGPEPDDKAEAEPEHEHDYPLPPATFEYLVASLRFQAEASLGLFHFGDEKEQPKPSLPAAQHAIDLLAMLLEKTRGNLSLDERRLLENSLTELRFRYVRIAEEAGRK